MGMPALDHLSARQVFNLALFHTILLETPEPGRVPSAELLELAAQARLALESLLPHLSTPQQRAALRVIQGGIP